MVVAIPFHVIPTKSTHVLSYCDNNITCVLLVSETRVISMLLIVITKHLYFLHNMFYCNVSLHSLILLLSSGRNFRDNHYEAFIYMYIKAIFSTIFILPDSSLCLKLQNLPREFEVSLIPISVIHQSIHSSSIHPSIHSSIVLSIH